MRNNWKIALMAIGSLTAAFSIYALSTKERVADHWSEMNEFETRLAKTVNDDPADIDFIDSAVLLSEVHVKGLAVCANSEISAEQYIEITEIADAIGGELEAKIYKDVDRALDQNGFASDCLFRVIQKASANLIRPSN